MSELSQKQELFSRSLGEFLVWIHSDPSRAIRRPECLRSQAAAAQNAAAGSGITHSLHTLGLAVDLQLFVDGVWQTKSEQYAELGSKWKSFGPDHTWGGDFHDRPDGNHFSITYEGVR